MAEMVVTYPWYIFHFLFLFSDVRDVLKQYGRWVLDRSDCVRMLVSLFYSGRRALFYSF